MKIQKDTLIFIRNMTICVVALLMVAFLLDMTPGFKRNKYTNIINLIIDDEDYTGDLKHLIYLGNSGEIFLSEDDISNIFSNKIYHEREYSREITAKDIREQENLGIADIQKKNESIENRIIEKNGIKYIPMVEMAPIYNISIRYVEESNRVIIDKLDKQIVYAEACCDTKIQYKARNLSKTVGNLKKGEKVRCFYTTKGGWQLIRTEDGLLRLC